MVILRGDPGPCPICGAAHTACTTNSGPIRVTILEARDAVPTVPPSAAAPSPPPPSLVADQIQAGLPPGHFTTATYRSPKPKAKGRRR